MTVFWGHGVVPTQHAIHTGSVNYIMSSRENWAVNRHTTRCTGPNPWSYSIALAVVRLRATETEISAAPWAREIRKELWFL